MHIAHLKEWDLQSTCCSTWRSPGGSGRKNSERAPTPAECGAQEGAGAAAGAAPPSTLTMRYLVAKLAVATVSSCAHLPWMTDVWFLRAWLSTAFHTCGRAPASIGTQQRPRRRAARCALPSAVLSNGRRCRSAGRCPGLQNEAPCKTEQAPSTAACKTEQAPNTDAPLQAARRPRVLRAVVAPVGRKAPQGVAGGGEGRGGARLGHPGAGGVHHDGLLVVQHLQPPPRYCLPPPGSCAPQRGAARQQGAIPARCGCTVGRHHLPQQRHRGGSGTRAAGGGRAQQIAEGLVSPPSGVRYCAGSSAATAGLVGARGPIPSSYYLLLSAWMSLRRRLEGAAKSSRKGLNCR